MDKKKVIGVGFHKTGTSTLELVLKKLGYNVVGSRTGLAKNLFKNDFNSVFQIADQYNAFQDNPWAILYKELDQRYPGSKFILTYRDEEKWIKSLVNHFGEEHTLMREFIYGVGSPKGYEETYLKRYKEHNEEVKSYFKNRPNDLLIVNWEKGDQWDSICQFLNLPTPKEQFPRANKGFYFLSKKNVQRAVKMKHFLKKLMRKLN